MRVFVNEVPLDLPAAATVRDAVLAHDATLAEALGHTVRATDGRGIELDLAASLSAGSIIRVIRTARAAGHADS
jgi:hypothetical protein